MVNHSIQVYARLKYQTNNDRTVMYQIVKKEEKFDDLVFYNDLMQSGGTPCNFRFHKVFDQKCNQENVFDNVAKPVITSALQGFNGTIFAYGQTGSGKTYSITGSPKDYNDRGIIPRSIQYVFAQNEKVTIKPTIYISYMEIYNEIGYDLLSSRHDNTARSLEELPRIVLLEDSTGEVHMRNLSVLPVTTEQEAMRLLFLGDTNRTIAETSMNEYSSRSHCIFTIYITFRDESSNTVRYSKLHLVDLAGSERVYKSLTTGTALREAKHINLSLHYLQQVILALSESKRLHIPYRNSMMTYILKDSLSGNCLTAMLATLALSKDNIQETISTCRFAQRVSLITTAPVINEIHDPQKEIIYLKNKVEELRKQVTLLSGLSACSILNNNQEEQCKKEIDKYLAYPQDELKVEPSMAYIQYCFKVLKNKINNQKLENKEKELDYARSQKEMATLKDTIVKQDQEINTLRKMIDGISETAVNSNEYIKNNLGSHLEKPETDTDGNVLANYEKSKENQYFKDDKYYKNLSKFDSFTSEIETENQLFEIFLKNPENAKDLEFYTNNLQKKLEIAKIYADTIDQCQKNITYIRQQLQTRSSYPVKNKLLIELEEQQKVYSRSLEDLKTVKNETCHLQSGLKKAEINTMRMFKNWLDHQKTSDSNNNFFVTDSGNIAHSEMDRHYYACMGKPNILKKTSRKDFSCGIANEQVSLGCCNTLHSASCWTDYWSGNLCAGPIYQPLVMDQNQYYNQSESATLKLHKCKTNSHSFNNDTNHKEVRYSNILSGPKVFTPLEEVTPKTKICQSCSFISNKKEPNKSLTILAEVNDNAYSCKRAISQYQKREKYINELSDDSRSEYEEDCSDTTTTAEAVYVRDSYRCPYPSVVNIPNQQRDAKGQVPSESNHPTEKIIHAKAGAAKSDLFLETDSDDFKEFMKTVSLSGDYEIDQEIFNFYRNKFCS